MSKFVRSNPQGTPRLPGVQQQRLYGSEVAVGEPYQLHGNAELKREIESSLEIIAQERLMEVEAQAKSFLIRAKEEAGKILEKSNAQAREMLVQAQSEVDGIRENSYEEGFKTGFQEGYTDATAQVTVETQELLQGAQVLVDGAYLAEKRVMQHFESRTLELIRHIVRQIVHREMSDSPATLMGMIHSAIESLYLNGKVQVVVSAQVIHELRSFAAATEKSLDGMRRFEFIADPILERHQIYIIGQDSCFDLSPDTQADHLMAAMESHFTLPREVPDSVEAIQPEATIPIAEPLSLDSMTVPQEDSSVTEADVLALESLTAMAALPEALAVVIADAEILVEMPLVETAFISELSEPSELDPVAWEEFPPDIQQLGGFPSETEALEQPVDALAHALGTPADDVSKVVGDIVSLDESDDESTPSPSTVDPELTQILDPDNEAL